MHTDSLQHTKSCFKKSNMIITIHLQLYHSMCSVVFMIFVTFSPNSVFFVGFYYLFAFCFYEGQNLEVNDYVFGSHKIS